MTTTDSIAPTPQAGTVAVRVTGLASGLKARELTGLRENRVADETTPVAGQEALPERMRLPGAGARAH